MRIALGSILDLAMKPRASSERALRGRIRRFWTGNRRTFGMASCDRTPSRRSGAHRASATRRQFSAGGNPHRTPGTTVTEERIPLKRGRNLGDACFRLRRSIFERTNSTLLATSRGSCPEVRAGAGTFAGSFSPRTRTRYRYAFGVTTRTSEKIGASPTVCQFETSAPDRTARRRPNMPVLATMFGGRWCGRGRARRSWFVFARVYWFCGGHWGLGAKKKKKKKKKKLKKTKKKTPMVPEQAD